MYERGFLRGKLNKASYTVYEEFLSEPPSSSTKYLLIVKEVAVYDEYVKSKWRIC